MSRISTACLQKRATKSILTSWCDCANVARKTRRCESAIEMVCVRACFCAGATLFENCNANYHIHTHTLLSKLKWCINTNPKWKKQCLPSGISSLSVTCIINACTNPTNSLKPATGCNDYRSHSRITYRKPTKNMQNKQKLFISDLTCKNSKQ